ncbi:MAG: hypothetical protein WEA04_00760 [Candidatus Andersenbacteria bacterium]
MTSRRQKQVSVMLLFLALTASALWMRFANTLPATTDASHEPESIMVMCMDCRYGDPAYVGGIFSTAYHFTCPGGSKGFVENAEEVKRLKEWIKLLRSKEKNPRKIIFVDHDTCLAYGSADSDRRHITYLHQAETVIRQDPFLAGFAIELYLNHMQRHELTAVAHALKHKPRSASTH